MNWLPDWLFEGQLTVYAVLAAALIFVLVLWKQTPRRSYLIGGVALAMLLGLYFLLDVFVQTDKEQITHAVREMSAGVESHNVDRIFSQVSDTYNRHGLTKSEFRQASARIIEGGMVERLAVWGWEFEPDYRKKESASDKRETLAHVRFMAKPEGANGQSIYLVDAIMHLDVDGKWRLQSWEVFDPFHDGTTPVTVPQMP
jgi:hypothetical protein